MVSPSHTPGPWVYAGRLGFGHLVRSVGGDIAVGYSDKINGAGEANALLIAAAPDIFDALRQICLVWDAGGKPNAHQVAAAQAALMKAVDYGDWRRNGERA